MKKSLLKIGMRVRYAPDIHCRTGFKNDIGVVISEPYKTIRDSRAHYYATVRFETGDKEVYVMRLVEA